MNTIDIKQIIDKKGLDHNDVALQLFPGNKYARLALNRIMAGKAELCASQISKLALMCDVTISDLFSNHKWKSSVKESVHIYTSGDYRAELDTKNWMTKIFHNGSLFHESIIHTGAITLSEYLNSINILIEKHGKSKS